MTPTKSLPAKKITVEYECSGSVVTVDVPPDSILIAEFRGTFAASGYAKARVKCPSCGKEHYIVLEEY